MIMRLMGTAFVLAGLAGGAHAATANKMAPTLRDQEQAACYGDATTLCKEFVPDEKKIETCMRAKLDQVSPACRKFFD